MELVRVRTDMPRLVSRSKQVPFGFKFHQPQTGWRSRPFSSFDRIVQDLIRHRISNPAITSKFNLPTDYDNVANEVDEYNALRCEKMRWYEYIEGRTPLPAGGQAAVIPFQERPQRPRRQGVFGKVAAGALVLVEWVKSKEEAVPKEKSAARAQICARCTLNEQGDWSSFFTVAVSEKIREELQRARAWDLTTEFDEKLKVCSACSCPLPLKVHIPIDRILSRIPEESKADLDPDCWILAEANA